MTRYILVNKPARPTVGARGVRCRRARALLERYCTVSFETIVATFHLPLSLEYPQRNTHAEASAAAAGG